MKDFFCFCHGAAVCALLLQHCRTDIRTGMVYTMPTRVGMLLEEILFLLKYCGNRNAGGEIIIQYAIAGMIIRMGDRIFKAYADGDADIFMLLVLAGTNHGARPVPYALEIILCSCTSFVAMMLVMNLIRLVLWLIKHRKVSAFRFISRAPMLPAVTVGFLLQCFR